MAREIGSLSGIAGIVQEFARTSQDCAGDFGDSAQARFAGHAEEWIFTIEIARTTSRNWRRIEFAWKRFSRCEIAF
jgi:hypothetical protein